MTIIDVHAHIWSRDTIPEKFWHRMAKYIAHKASSTAEIILKSNLMKVNYEGRGDLLIQQMDSARIEKAVVFGADWGLYLGEPEKPIQELNQLVSETAKEHPDRLIPFFTIDPRRKKAVEQFDNAVTRQNMKGLKLHPTTGYKLTGEETYKIFEKAQDLNVPILSHMGYIPGLLGRYSQPNYFDQVTTDFPELRICVAHMNHGDTENLASLLEVKNNLSVDISAYGQISLATDPNEFYIKLKHFLKHFPNRILFGSDWPMTSNMLPLDKFREKLQNLPENQEVTKLLKNQGYGKFKKSEINKLLGKNAIKFLNP